MIEPKDVCTEIKIFSVSNFALYSLFIILNKIAFLLFSAMKMDYFSFFYFVWNGNWIIQSIKSKKYDTDKERIFFLFQQQQFKWNMVFIEYLHFISFFSVLFEPSTLFPILLNFFLSFLIGCSFFYFIECMKHELCF